MNKRRFTRFPLPWVFALDDHTVSTSLAVRDLGLYQYPFINFAKEAFQQILGKKQMFYRRSGSLKIEKKHDSNPHSTDTS